MRMLALVAMFAAIEPSCRGGAEAGGEAEARGKVATPEVVEPTTPPPAKADAVSKPDPCGAAALGLGQAVALARWTPPPTGCTPQGSGTAIVRSGAELATRLECAAGTVAAIDFSQHALLSHGYSISPAGAGLVVFDDGKVVTLVTRQRDPCPGAPMPMPMNATAWFLLPAGAERTFANTICTIDSQCS